MSFRKPGASAIDQAYIKRRMFEGVSAEKISGECNVEVACVKSFIAHFKKEMEAGNDEPVAVQTKEAVEVRPAAADQTSKPQVATQVPSGKSA